MMQISLCVWCSALTRHLLFDLHVVAAGSLTINCLIESQMNIVHGPNNRVYKSFDGSLRILLVRSVAFVFVCDG